jgi:hypothetical protein
MFRRKESGLVEPLKNTSVKSFVLGSKAVFTIQNERTGNRFTFKVDKAYNEAIVNPKVKNLFFVSVLSGPANMADYSYMGKISQYQGERYFFTQTKGSKVSQDSQSFKVFSWFLNAVLSNKLPGYIKVYHQGFCARCGRPLTTPESLSRGFGDYCYNQVTGA